MTAVGWFVYAVSVASVVLSLGLLLWTLQVRMMREMRGEIVATYHSARRRSDDRVDADSDPTQRNDLGNTLNIRPLPTAERTRFVDGWRALQPRFVNEPDDAVKEADRLISDVMRTRGYPMGAFAEHAADISVEYPNIVSHYREAHRVAQRAANGQATMAEERRALDEYREIFNELLADGPSNVSAAMPVSQTG